jgi:photosystem II stability/assembly factor-like uncharacterized protein
MEKYYVNKPAVIKIIFFSVLLISFFQSHSYSQYGWTQYQTPINTGLYKIYMTDSLNGWTVGANDTIFYTTNGGTNWIVKVISGYAGFHDVFFLNQNTGWIVGSLGFVLKTTNSGNSWFLQYSDTLQWLLGIKFVDANYGWAVGLFGLILHTSNGGSNWVQQTSGISFTIFSLCFINQSTGWVSASSGVVLKTTDGGQQWFQQSTGVMQRLYDIQFINENTGWAAGFYPSGSPIIKTTNGGVNWILQFFDNSDYNSVFFINPQTGWVSGQLGSILYTSNSGDNWTLQSTGIIDFVHDVFFVTPTLGWASCGSGKILKTATGGIVSITSNSGEIPKETKLSQNYPNPFNSNTNIKYQISKDSYVKLIIYNACGQIIQVLVNEYKSVGYYECTLEMNELSSGVYFYRLSTEYNSITKIIVLLK